MCYVSLFLPLYLGQLHSSFYCLQGKAVQSHVCEGPWSLVGCSPQLPPTLCPLAMQQQAAGTEPALGQGRAIPTPLQLAVLASSQTEVDVTGPANGLPKGQQQRKSGT